MINEKGQIIVYGGTGYNLTAYFNFGVKQLYQLKIIKLKKI
jgi:hypothetical protein